MTDWQKIKTEYITSNISYRDLSKKYGISFSMICDRGNKEEWAKLRKKSKEKIVAKSVQKFEEAASTYRSGIYQSALKVAKQLDDLVDENTIAELIALGVKPRDITGALKDLKDVLDIKSQADIEEQKARIDSLRKQCEDKAADTAIKVVIAPDAEGFGE